MADFSELATRAFSLALQARDVARLCQVAEALRLLRLARATLKRAIEAERNSPVDPSSDETTESQGLERLFARRSNELTEQNLTRVEEVLAICGYLEEAFGGLRLAREAVSAARDCDPERARRLADQAKEALDRAKDLLDRQVGSRPRERQNVDEREAGDAIKAGRELLPLAPSPAPARSVTGDRTPTRILSTRSGSCSATRPRGTATRSTAMSWTPRRPRAVPASRNRPAALSGRCAGRARGSPRRSTG